MRAYLPENIRQIGDYVRRSFVHKDKALKESQVLKKHHLKPKGYALATIHRAENTDDPRLLQEIFFGLAELAQSLPVILPLHPRTRQALQRINLYETMKTKLLLIDRVGYLDMIQLECNAQAIFTDSEAESKKEAYYFKVPCLTLRTETEWVELVDHGFNRLVPLERKEIVKQYQKALNSKPNWDIFLYGQGNASAEILKKSKAMKRRIFFKKNGFAMNK